MKEPGTNYGETQLVTPKQRRQASTKRANAKIEEIREQLRAMAFEKGAGSQFPTIRELCTLLNTSSATLTAALDLLETEQIISRKERQGIFVTNAIHRKTIYIIFNIFPMTDLGQSPFWSLLWGKILQESEQNAAIKNEQYRIHFLCRPYGQALPDDYVAFLNSSQVDGCLIVGANARTQEHKTLLHIPHVVFSGGGDIMVQMDTQEMTILAAQTLMQQNCKKMSCLTPGLRTNGWLAELNQNLFKQSLVDHNYLVYPEFFRFASTPPSFANKSFSPQEEGYLLIKELFGSLNHNRPDGLYITDDMMTSGALVALEELGVRIGEDVKIVSHTVTDSPILFGKTKCMTTIEFNAADVVRAMFSLLDLAIINGYQPGETIHKIKPRLRT